MFDSLPGTRVEAARIGLLWSRFHSRLPDAVRADRAWRTQQGTIVELEGAEATERAFKTRAPGRSVLHIATHGFFLGGECAGSRPDLGDVPTEDDLDAVPVEAENPLLLSGLALAGANLRTRATDSEEDGILTAEEVTALDLGGVDWAVLSACETGLGEIRAGEGVFGLRRAFRVAGVRTLIMTLWQVDDRSAALWMESLFKHRLKERMSTPEAVREASLDVLRTRRSEGLDGHPFYWGAFVAAGGWE